MNENLESQLNQGADNLSVILMIAKGLGVAEERVMTLAHIIEERKRQDQKWGEQNHNDHYWFLIATEELGEIAKAMQENDSVEFQLEVTQLAAVMFAWMECKFRNASKEGK